MELKYAVQRGCTELFFALLCGLLLFSSTGGFAQSSSKDPAKLSPAETTALVGQARQLVLENRMQAAFALLQPHELALAGNPDYDYLLGTAALDSGHADLAIFALERVLEQKPQFAGARLELARAYFDIGDSEAARYHFDYLQGQNPPPHVRQAITSYLRAIDRVAAAYKPIHLPHFAAGFGWDSNANASTAEEQFLGFVLDGNNVKSESPYYFATLGDYYSRPLSPGVKMMLTGSLGQRNYPDASFVNSTDVAGSAALEWRFGDTRITPAIGAAWNWLDGDDNLDRFTSDLAISHSVSDDWKLLGGISAAAHRFSGALEIQDVNVYDARVGFEHYLNPARASVISVLALAGTNSARDSESPFDNDHWALMVRGSRLLTQGLLLSLDANARNTDFNGLFFGESREDKQWGAAFSLHLFDWPAQGWRVIGRLGYTDVDSDLELYTYDRTEVGLTFHRAFE
jgi:tetratricopeptide (TPR) repeat protein